MSNPDPAPAVSGLGSSRRRLQFSLREIFLAMLVLAAVLATAAQFPRWSAFVVLMTCLTILPLAVTGVMRRALECLRRPIGDDDPHCATANGSSRRVLARLADFLGLRSSAFERRRAIALAGLSALVIVGLWPILREIGLVMALVRTSPLEDVLDYARRGPREAFGQWDYWKRLWVWEAWSLARWWLLCGSLTLLWLIVSTPWNRRRPAERWTGAAARLLAFAPWLTLLEMLFLIGVWVESPVTVPEPSTGFVVGIFSWNLWHWDCWFDRGWLIRGAIPTLLVGAAFFRHVLRWPWPFAGFGGVFLIPVALTLSVAWTLLYQPW